MTDALAERFAALADHADDSDWLDVRRRARRRVRVALPAAVVSAALCAAAAIAASGGWLFSGNGSALVGVTHVTINGTDWRVTLNDRKTGDTSFIVVSATSGGARSRGGIADVTALGSDGARFAAASTFVPGGSIWAGTTQASIVRVSITDYAGHAYAANTVAPPQRTKTPYRFWAIAVTGAPAATLKTYTADGKSTLWRLGMSAPG